MVCAGIRKAGDSPLENGALKTWQRAFSAGDREAFLRRLSWDGFDAWSLAAALEVSESTPANTTRMDDMVAAVRSVRHRTGA